MPTDAKRRKPNQVSQSSTISEDPLALIDEDFLDTYLDSFATGGSILKKLELTNK